MRNLGVGLLIATFSAGSLGAQSTSGPAAKLVARAGLVEVQRGGVWLPISFGDQLKSGERVQTGSGSSAALEIGPGKIVTLNEGTEVEVPNSSGIPRIWLQRGSMKVVSGTDIQIAAKDTALESAEGPLDMELGYQGAKLNLTVFSGAVRNGAMVIHGGGQNSNLRTYTANGRSSQRNGLPAADPAIYVYPYFMYGNSDPNAGRIVPPVVNNPANRGLRR